MLPPCNTCLAAEYWTMCTVPLELWRSGLYDSWQRKTIDERYLIRQREPVAWSLLPVESIESDNKILISLDSTSNSTAQRVRCHLCFSDARIHESSAAGSPVTMHRQLVRADLWGARNYDVWILLIRGRDSAYPCLPMPGIVVTISISRGKKYTRKAYRESGPRLGTVIVAATLIGGHVGRPSCSQISASDCACLSPALRVASPVSYWSHDAFTTTGILRAP